ncbi:MAG TPA: DNA ligase D [Polyangiaceae bacterium]|nr:DNA ligase D [Polyangiaceae bacterium]
MAARTEVRRIPYRKVKCTKRQEFIIVGFTDPTGSRSHLGSLLLALRRGRALVYAGRVGTGFTEQSLRDLHQRLVTRLEPRLTLDNAPREADTRDVHWVRPDLVAEVQFLGITEDGLLRHASFQGLREDKQPGQVQLELPQKSPAPAASESKTESRSRTSKSGHVSGASNESTPHSELLRGLTHSNKAIYPEMGVTKQELAEYYAAIATYMLPHVAKRPLTLVRCPNGRDKACFFQKHPSQGAPDAIKAVMVREKEGKAPYAVVDDVAGLIALVQLAVLEIHTWGSHADTPTKPDLLVFDLDPDVELPFAEVITCAKRTRSLFEGLGLESFVKTTGGKGLHVCVPIVPDLEWDEVKAFCRRVAQEIAKQEPDKYLDVANKSKRKGKIYIDYLRNARGATFIAPYSTRAREGAPIATPLEWDELSPRLVPAQFNLRTLAQRLAKIGSDPFARMQSLHQRLRP